MGYNRLSADIIGARSGFRSKANKGPSGEYLFSLHRWEAIAYLARMDTHEGFTVVEGPFVEPAEVFPPNVMRRVDYGLRYGLDAHVTQFFKAEGMSVAGAILELFSGGRYIGVYAVRTT